MLEFPNMPNWIHLLIEHRLGRLHLEFFNYASITALVAAVTVLVGVIKAVKIVPQSQNFVVEQLGKYKKTLKPGPHLIIPGLQSVRHKVDVLERALANNPIDAITKDNAPISVTVSTFFRILEPSVTVYRIKNIETGVHTIVTGAVRSLIGSVDFDELQSNRAKINSELEEALTKQAAEWGIEITRSEVLDVNFDEATKQSLQQQINAERERRAQVTRAEGAKRAIELNADAQLYEAQKQADARRIEAEADAYATQVVAEAIKVHGDDPLRIELMRQQIEAMKAMGTSNSAKTIVLPSDMANSVTGLGAFMTEFVGQLPKAAGSGKA